ncbi:MAG: 2OG-Fe(II) oxygenase [Gammaproteobacteria bacterium]|nr:2OG-Fe(II) oxygenase [Gammaproteobacteria bacterium]
MFDFYTDHEKKITQQFLKDKHIIIQAEDMDSLNAIRKKVAHAAADAIDHQIENDTQIDSFLNNIHKIMTVDQLNDIRLKVITEMNRDTWFRLAYFKIARNALNILAGNELAMQRRVNLSIQLPNDDSSLLPVHADVWAGDSPFEIVLWVPLVNCYATKSMFITDAETDKKIQADFSQFKDKSSEDIYQSIESNVKFLDVPFGSVLLFSQNVMHGNRINRENETRWSMNCRFKSILTPYRGKKMGEFFQPITVRPLTRLGLDYRLPEGLYEE